jgi:hypothetical protein
VPRDRIERIFRDYLASPELPRQLAVLEARWLSSEPAPIDYGRRIGELETQRANLIAAIKSGGLATELAPELKIVWAELERMKALSETKPAARRKGPEESLDRRVERILERLAQGGEVAQGVVRELFPDGVWLYPDPNGGRFLWAQGQTAWPANWASLVDTEGRPLADAFPRVYNEIANEIQSDVSVAGSGSGGLITEPATTVRWSLAA